MMSFPSARWAGAVWTVKADDLIRPEPGSEHRAGEIFETGRIECEQDVVRLRFLELCRYHVEVGLSWGEVLVVDDLGLTGLLRVPDRSVHDLRKVQNVMTENRQFRVGLAGQRELGHRRSLHRGRRLDALRPFRPRRGQRGIARAGRDVGKLIRLRRSRAMPSRRQPTCSRTRPERAPACPVRGPGSRPARGPAIVPHDQLKLAAENAATRVDVLDGHLRGTQHVLTIGAQDTGQVSDPADLDRLAGRKLCRSRSRPQQDNRSGKFDRT